MVLSVATFWKPPLNHHVFVSIITKRGIQHDGASFQIEQKNFEPKIKKICPAEKLRKYFFAYIKYNFIDLNFSHEENSYVLDLTT